MKVRRQTECVHRESGGPDTADIRSEVNKKIRNTGGRDRPKSADGAARPDSTAINPYPAARNREKTPAGDDAGIMSARLPPGCLFPAASVTRPAGKNMSSYLL